MEKNYVYVVIRGSGKYPNYGQTVLVGSTDISTRNYTKVFSNKSDAIKEFKRQYEQQFRMLDADHAKLAIESGATERIGNWEILTIGKTSRAIHFGELFEVEVK